MDVRNSELINRRFDQIDGKIRHLRHLLNGQSTPQDFNKGLEELQQLQDEVRSMVNRDQTPLQNG
tara:strand:+ start:62 stop:256 length:195 start_codon:yes stop_codon:yes gene_type:complete